MRRIEIGGQVLEIAEDQPLPPRSLRAAWISDGAGGIAVDDAVALSVTKSRLIAAVEAKAGAIRAKYITDQPGQDLLYERKRREADYVVDQGSNANPALCPVLSASVGIEAPTLADCAALVLSRESLWASIAAQIETRRLGGKAAILAAATVAAAEAAFAAIDWAGL